MYLRACWNSFFADLSLPTQANMMIDKQARHPPTNHEQLLPHKSTHASGSLKRPFDLSQNETKAKKQKKEGQPGACKIPYQRDLDRKDTGSSDRAQDPDSDEVSIAEVLAKLGR